MVLLVMTSNTGNITLEFSVTPSAVYLSAGQD